jgi:hypothetical protein
MRLATRLDTDFDILAKGQQESTQSRDRSDHISRLPAL